jgi:hypothetical protein
MLGSRSPGKAAAWLVPDPAGSAATRKQEAAEARLLSGVSTGFCRTCTPKRRNLPDTAPAGVNCWPAVGPFRLRYYVFDPEPDLVEEYFAELSAGGATGDEDSPGTREAGRSTIPRSWAE